MKKLITFVFLFSFFAAGILNFQAVAQTANQSVTQATTTGGQTSITGGQTPTVGGQAQGQASNGTYAGVSQAGLSALGGKKSSDLSAAEWNAISDKDRAAILAEERIQDVMKQEGVSREEAQKSINEHDKTTAANIEKNKQDIAEAQAGKKCNKDGSNFTKYLLSYVGRGGGNFCWFCPMFEGLFDAMNNLATAISVKMADVFLMIMGVGLLFSIAFKVGKMVTSMQGADLMQFLTDMFKHLGRAIIATALLVSSLSIFTYLVSPVLTMSMSMSSIIMDEGGGRGAVIKATQSTGISAGSICDDLADQMKTTTSVANQTKAFTPDVKASFVCALRTMSAGLIFGVLLGVIIYSLAFTDLIAGLFPNVMYALLGLIIVIGHLAILISFPFKLIDSMIRMAFVTALMPLWIILWVFPATVGYTKKAWDLFLSSCLIFICLSVIITMVMTIMQYAIPNREEIIGLLVCGFDKQAADKIPIGGKELLVTAALTFLGWKMLGTATTLASSFVGAIPDLGIGQSINETTVKGAKLAGKGARAGGRALANSKLGQKAGEKLNLNNRSAAKLGAWAAAGVATAGIAPAGYGLVKGGWTAGKAALNKFRGGGAAPTGGTPNVPPQGNAPTGETPNVPPQGNAPEGTPNVPPQGTPNVPPQGNAPEGTPDVPPQGTPDVPPQGNAPEGTPNVPPQGNAPTEGTPNVPPQGNAPTPSTSTSSSADTPSETMTFTSGAPTSDTTPSFSGSANTETSTSSSADTPSETMMFTSGAPTSDTTPSFSGSANTETSTSSSADTPSETMTFTSGTPASDTTPSSSGSVNAETSSEREGTSAQESNAQETSTPQNETSSDSSERDTVDQQARSMVREATVDARQAAADARQAAMQSSGAQATAAQALSEASRKDKDDDKKNKPE